MKRWKQLTTMVGMALAMPALAAAEPGYDARAWQPVHDGSGLFSVYGVQTVQKQHFNLGFAVDYARNPIVLGIGNNLVAPVITDATTLEVGAFYGIMDSFEAGLVIPLSFHGYQNPVTTDRQRGAEGTGLGDIRIAAKYRLLAPKDFVPGVAFAAELSLPTGDEISWFGSGAVLPSVHGILEEHVGPVRLYGNVGYQLRGEDDDVWGSSIGDAFMYGAGAAWNTGWQKLTVLGEVGGFADVTGGPTPVEFGLGLKRELPQNMSLAVGVNAGAGNTLGAPAFRTYATFNWTLGKKPAPVVKADPIVKPKVEPIPPRVRKPVKKVLKPKPTPEPEPEPLKTAGKVVVKEKIISIPHRILFNLNSAVIKEQSFGILDEVAAVMEEHDELLIVRIEGHTDSSGGALFNQVLSVRRARAVRRYLITQGVDSDRLKSKGYGEKKPLVGNTDEEGRATNRRVEFKILKRKDETAQK